MTTNDALQGCAGGVSAGECARHIGVTVLTNVATTIAFAGAIKVIGGVGTKVFSKVAARRAAKAVAEEATESVIKKTLRSRIGDTGSRAIGRVRESLPSRTSPWSLGWSDRGLLIEKRLGGNLPPAFPTIDRFKGGVVTSIKSIDLNAKTYQSSSALTRKLKGYVDKAAGFNGANFDGVRVKSSEITERGLDIAIPAGRVPAGQQAVLDEIEAYGVIKGVTVRVKKIR